MVKMESENQDVDNSLTVIWNLTLNVSKRKFGLNFLINLRFDFEFSRLKHFKIYFLF